MRHAWNSTRQERLLIPKPFTIQRFADQRRSAQTKTRTHLLWWVPKRATAAGAARASKTHSVAECAVDLWQHRLGTPLRKHRPQNPDSGEVAEDQGTSPVDSAQQRLGTPLQKHRPQNPAGIPCAL